MVTLQRSSSGVTLHWQSWLKKANCFSQAVTTVGASHLDSLKTSIIIETDGFVREDITRWVGLFVEKIGLYLSSVEVKKLATSSFRTECKARLTKTLWRGLKIMLRQRNNVTRSA